jgi:hypothetical protein
MILAPGSLFAVVVVALVFQVSLILVAKIQKPTLAEGHCGVCSSLNRKY